MRFATAAAIALVAIALSAGGALAYTLAGWQYGDVMPSVDARALVIASRASAWVRRSSVRAASRRTSRW